MKNLATIYRPKQFSDVIGQGYVKQILEHQLQTGQFKQAYLFCGGAGTGKTTSARIFSNEVNEGKGNPIEIDAASNNGVDNIRNIIEECSFKSIDSKYKVFIIDECHMLSTGAFNALLKILEEPPAGVMFILCTTDPQKIPNTILSRVQRYDFKRIETKLIKERLDFILQEEERLNGVQIKVEEGVTTFISKLAQGGMRDAITMLDKCLGYTYELSFEQVELALGVPNYCEFIDLLNSINKYDTEKALLIIHEVFMSGKELKLFVRNFADFILEVTKYSIVQDINLTTLPHEVEAGIKNTWDNEFLLDMVEEFNELANIIKWEPHPKVIVECKLLVLTRG